MISLIKYGIFIITLLLLISTLFNLISLSIIFVIITIFIIWAVIYGQKFLNGYKNNSYKFFIDNYYKHLVEGDDLNYINYGYWKDNPINLKGASDNLCKLLYTKGDFQGKILDVGCGTGEQIKYWKTLNENLHIEGIDLDEHVVNLAKKKNLNVSVGNATQLKFKDETFDAVVCLESAFHYKTREKFLKEAYRVLKKDGKLIIADIILNDKKQNFYNKIFKNLFNKTFNITKENLISIKEFEKQLKNIGFKCEIEDITDHTFKPFYRYFFNNIKTTIFSDIIFRGGSYYINSLCEGTTCYKYVLAVCKK